MSVSNRCFTTLLVCTTGLALATTVRADVISWVGYQAGPPYIFRNAASWFHGDQWFNYVVPGAADSAVFDAAFDPQGNGMPNTVYFGDYMVAAAPPIIPTGFLVPGGDALVTNLEVHEGDFTFRLESSFGTAQGSLTASGAMVVSARPGGSSSLTLHGPAYSAGRVFVAGSNGALARLSLVDANLSVPTTSLVDVGIAGTRGELLISGNSLFQSGYARIGENAGSDGLMRVDGPNARAEVVGMQVGAGSIGRVDVVHGASLVSGAGANVSLANFGGVRGELHVRDDHSELQIQQNFIVGTDGEGVFSVGSGALAHVSGFMSIANNPGSVGVASVDGTGSVLLHDSRLNVGSRGAAMLDVTSGGSVHGLAGLIARRTGSTGSATVSGAGSDWSVTDYMYVGGDTLSGAGGTGALAVRDGGSVTVGTTLETWAQGTVNVAQQGRLLVGTGDAASVPAGSILVNTGGTLAGSGTIVGDVLVSGGTLRPGNSPGTLSILGNLALSDSSTTVIEIGGDSAGLFDVLDVSGTTSLHGLLVLNFVNGYVPQTEFSIDIFTSAGGVFDTFDQVQILNVNPSLVSTSITSGTVTLNVIPAPSALPLGLLAFPWCSRRRRRHA